MTQTITKRLLLNHARDGYFCDVCGIPATNSCEDARQTGISPADPKELGSAKADPVENESTWVLCPPRFGCNQHPVVAMLYFASGRNVAAKDFNLDY